MTNENGKKEISEQSLESFYNRMKEGDSTEPMPLEQSPDEHFERQRGKVLKHLAAANVHKKELANAIACFTDSKCPSGLFKYRNDLDVQILQLEQMSKVKADHEH